MSMKLDTVAMLALSLLVLAPPGAAQTRDAEAGAEAAETAARRALEAFITQWNTADDANLRRAMHFPFATVPGGGALIVNDRPEDFSAGFGQMRAREGWSRSSFDFDSYTVVGSSPEKVHAAIGFSRYGADGTAYRTSRVFYIVTRRDDGWAIQLRAPAGEPDDLDPDKRAEIVAGARRAVLDFFTAFNTGDVDGTVATLNHPHLFMTPGGGFSVAESPGDGPRPDFDRMRRDEGWHVSTIDALEPRARHAEQGALRADLLAVAPRRHPLLDRARAVDRDPLGGPLGHPGPLAHAGHLRRAGPVGWARPPVLGERHGVPHLLDHPGIAPAHPLVHVTGTFTQPPGHPGAGCRSAPVQLHSLFRVTNGSAREARRAGT